MMEFKYGLVGHPIENPTQTPHRWRLCTNTDRVKWLWDGSFALKSVGPQEIVLTAKPNFPGTIKSVRFVIFDKQERAVAALVAREVDFVPAITNPTCVETVKMERLPRWEAPSHYNLNYLGFRTDREPFNTAVARRAVIKSLDVNAALDAANVLSWKAAGLLPEFPGDELYRMANPQTGAPDLSNTTLLYNNNEPIDKAIALDIETQLKVKAVGRNGYGDLVETIRNDQDDEHPKCHWFLYNWYVKSSNLRRVLFPLFHSKSISHPNLTRYDKADGPIDQLPEPSIDDKRGLGALEKIFADAPIFVLYHTRRTAAWQKNVRGLDGNLTDPECNPADRLESVTVV